MDIAACVSATRARKKSDSNGFVTATPRHVARTEEDRFERPGLWQIGLERHSHEKAQHDLQVANLAVPANNGATGMGTDAVCHGAAQHGSVRAFQHHHNAQGPGS